MRRFLDVLARISGFAAVSALSIVASLIAIPVVARHSSHAEWAALAVGQSIGSCAGILAGYGWSLTGPSKIAKATESERRDHYASALAVHVTLCAVMLPAAALLSWMLAPHDAGPLAAAMGSAMAVNGMTVGWYSIGLGKPGILIRYELLPRVVAGTVTAAMINFGAPLVIYPTLAAAVGIGGPMSHAVATLGRPRWSMIWRLRRRLRGDLKEGWSATVAEGAAGIYSWAAAALMSTQTGVAEISQYSSGDRLYRISLFPIGIVSNASQAWVVESTGFRAWSRLRLAIGVQLAIGSICFIGMAAGGPLVTGLLFGEDLAVGRQTAFFLGLSCLAISINTIFARYILAPQGRTRVVMISTLVGAIAGVPLILVGSREFGASGAAAALAASQALVAVMEARAAISHVIASRGSGLRAATQLSVWKIIN